MLYCILYTISPSWRGVCVVNSCYWSNPSRSRTHPFPPTLFPLTAAAAATAESAVSPNKYLRAERRAQASAGNNNNDDNNIMIVVQAKNAVRVRKPLLKCVNFGDLSLYTLLLFIHNASTVWLYVIVYYNIRVDNFYTRFT